MIDIQNDDGLSVLKERLTDPSNIKAAGLLKTASIDADFGDIIDAAFADPVNRKFPIYSPDMSVVSALYMQGQDVDPLVKEACDNALKEWNIEEVATESLVKVASFDEGIPEDMFLLASSKKLPIVDQATLEKSASFLIGNMNSLDVAERVEASSKLYKIATEQYGISPDSMNEAVIRYAQEAPCDLNKLAMSVSERFAETQHAAYKEMIPKIASLKEEIGGSVSFDKSVNSGIAYDLFMLDKEANALDIFDSVYDVFNAPFMENEEGELEKAASENSIVIGHYTINENDLSKVAEEDVESAFAGFASSICEGGAVSAEKLEKVAEDMTLEAQNTLGKFLAPGV